MAKEANAVREAGVCDLLHKCVVIRAAAGDGRGDAIAGATKLRNRVDQDIRPFEHPELADEYDVGGVGRRFHRNHLVSPNAVVNDSHNTIRSADGGLEFVASELALEQEQVGAGYHVAFGRAVDHSLRRVAAVVQGAAVRRVDFDRGTG